MRRALRQPMCKQQTYNLGMASVSCPAQWCRVSLEYECPEMPPFGVGVVVSPKQLLNKQDFATSHMPPHTIVLLARTVLRLYKCDLPAREVDPQFSGDLYRLPMKTDTFWHYLTSVYFYPRRLGRVST